MRDGWTETTLNQVLLSVLTRAKDNLDYEVLSVTERRGIIPQTEVFNHRIATDDISKYKVLQPGDIAFNPYLLWCGAIGQWKGNYEGVVSPVYECFRVRDTDSPRFVGLIFESGVLTPYFDSTAIGSIVRRRRTTLPVFYEAPIFRPPLEEQKRIVDVVSSVDAYIDALQQQAHSARKARYAVLHELLSAGGDDWTETTLGEIAKWGSGGTPKSDNPFYYDGDIPWCVIGDLTEGEVSITEKSISEEGLRNSSAKIVEPGAVMIAMYGASIGRTGIVAIPMATNQAIAFAYVDESKVINRYLFAYLQIQKQKFVDAGQGAAQPNISQTVLKDWPILLPSVKEQNRIVEIVSSMDEVIQSTEQAVVDAKSLRSGLLSDLLSGEYEIPVSYDSLLGAV